MDKNTVTGFILIAVVLFGFTWYNQPSQEEVEAMRTQDSIAAVAKQKAEQRAEQQKIAELQKKAEQAQKTAEPKKDLTILPTITPSAAASSLQSVRSQTLRPAILPSSLSPAMRPITRTSSL